MTKETGTVITMTVQQYLDKYTILLTSTYSSSRDLNAPTIHPQRYISARSYGGQVS